VLEVHEGSADLVESDPAQRRVAVRDEQVGEVFEQGEGELVGVRIDPWGLVVPAVLVVPLATVHDR
jgi:hypothetical protein